MSAKPSPELDPLDFVLRARSSTLGTEEQHALDRALATSAALRTARELGHDLDFVCRVRTRDQALASRAIERALAPTAPPRVHRAARVAGILVATLAIASAAAATHAVVVRRLAAVAPAGTAVPSTRPAAKPALSVSALIPPPGAERGTTPNAKSEPLPAQSRAPRPNPAGGVPVARVTNAEPMAAGLFREAGAARRAGDIAKARALYLELQSRFPTSNEAAVSHVSLGNLLLSAGDSGGAEKAFARYLRSGQHSLREEALAGLADALFAMGRTDDERRAREQLIGLDPGGVYASRARRRIAEIDEARHRSSR
jgi:TolA-binding protein